MTAEYQVRGSAAIITLNNPPVNGLNLATRSATLEAVHRAINDASIRVIVIMGAGTMFSGGADIKEFNSPDSMAQPSLHELIDTIEKSSKPVIAAINHVCMGGGLELALGCHYRIATTGTKIALPEVKLGLLPGGGGTQRLPRVVGLEIALKMISTGCTMLSENLANTALFDQIVDGDLLTGAITFAEKISDIRPLPKIRDLHVEHHNGKDVIQAARVAAQRSHLIAPIKCIDAIEAAISLPFVQGLKLEMDLFFQLMTGNESKALRHAFFAERAASKIPDVPSDTPIRAIKSIAVVGAGTMGGGIAMNFANVGIPVVILETRADALEKGLATIQKNYQNTRDKGKLSPEKCAERLALITGTLDYDQIGNADIVIEAVFEEMGVKRAVFEKLDSVMKDGAILASNTSTLDLNEIAVFTKRPQDVVGTHFFSPANVMKLVEIVRGQHTSKEVLATVMSMSKKIGKIGVVSGVCDGFIGNRMLEQYLRQAGFLLDEGCLPAQVDSAIEKLGFAMGPFRMYDLAGNDIAWAIRKRRLIEAPATVYSQTADLVCELGRFGQKTGAGWYDYQTGDRTAYPSELVNQLIMDNSKKCGIERRHISDQEIVERLIFSLVNEGAAILSEGIAQRASDIDMVYLSGYGFPAHLGGPMFYADTVGLPKVVAAMENYEKGQYGHAWKITPLLHELAGKAKTFNS